jgi:hypothetical protein
METSLFGSALGTLALYPLAFAAVFALLTKRKALLATCLLAIGFILLFVRAA